MVIAALAVVGRVIINSQRRGGINWPKVSCVVLSALAAVGVFATFDAYRLETAFLGEAEAEEVVDKPCQGRKPASDAPRLASLSNGALHRQFALYFDEVTPSGYYKRRLDPKQQPDLVDRQELVSAADSSKHQYKRVTNVFDITKNPQRQADYLPLCYCRLRSGEMVLCALPDYDAHPGESRLLSPRPLNDKLAQIAEKQPGCNQEVYLTGFDAIRYAAHRYTYLSMSLAAGALAAAAVVLIYNLIKRARRPNP